jgi:hypothetical protein
LVIQIELNDASVGHDDWSGGEFMDRHRGQV